MVSTYKVKLYELNTSNKLPKYIETLDFPIAFSSIGEVNKVEKLRKDSVLFPFTLKQDNLKELIQNNFEKVTLITTDDEYFDNELKEALQYGDYYQINQIIKELEDQDLEIEAVTIDINDINYIFTKSGTITVNHPITNDIKSLLNSNVIKKVIGII